MKILLFNCAKLLTSDGARMISALLKREGHEVKMVCLTKEFAPGDVRTANFTEEELDECRALIEPADLVMMAVLSPYSIRAAAISYFIRLNYPEKKILWGGPHCVSSYETALKHADMVCYAEGEEVVTDLAARIARGEDYTDVDNMAFMVNGEVKVNPLRPRDEDLDGLPMPDFDFEDQYILDDGLHPMNPDIFLDKAGRYGFGEPAYFCLTSKGCPHQCSYCNNVRYIKMYGRQRIRFRGAGSVMKELELMLARFPRIRKVWFPDDDFFSRDLESLKELMTPYKEKIGLPFAACCSFNTFRKEKMEVLVDAGLRFLEFGVQSASPRTLSEVYNRRVPLDRSHEVIRQVMEYSKSHGVRLMLDFIIDNPYETEEEVFETVRYLSSLPKGIEINVFSLCFFPGTPIFDRAVNDGYIDAEDESVYNIGYKHVIRYHRDLPTFLIKVFSKFPNVPRSLIRLLSTRAGSGLMHLVPKRLLFR